MDFTLLAAAAAEVPQQSTLAWWQLAAGVLGGGGGILGLFGLVIRWIINKLVPDLRAEAKQARIDFTTAMKEVQESHHNSLSSQRARYDIYLEHVRGDFLGALARQRDDFKDVSAGLRASVDRMQETSERTVVELTKLNLHLGNGRKVE